MKDAIDFDAGSEGKGVHLQRHQQELHTRQQHLAKQGGLTMIAAGAKMVGRSMQYAHSTVKLAERYHKGALRTRVKAVAHEELLRNHALEPLEEAALPSMAVSTMSQQQDNTSGILTTITDSTAGDQFFSERDNLMGSSVGFLIGNKSSSGGEGIFPAEGGILESMLLATSAAAQATMIDGDATAILMMVAILWCRLSTEPATVLDAQSTALTHNELPDGSVFYTQRELEKKLWRNIKTGSCRRKNDD